MTHGSVFSGIGGPEVAASMLGWENLFHCEINPFGRKILDYYYPNAESYEDITKTDFTKWRGRVNVLTGGFPCQPFSCAGKRRGEDDDRYLWPHMHRCINEIKPDWIVCENVAGILTMVEQGNVSEMAAAPTLFDEDDSVHRYKYQGTFTLERICRDCEADGYDVRPILIPACAVGAPHRRDRVFVVGRRIDADTNGRGDSPRSEDAAGNRLGAEMLSGSMRRGQGHSPSGNHGLSPVQGDASDTNGHRGLQVHEQLESELADGAVAVGNGRERYASDTESERSGGLRIESQEERPRMRDVVFGNGGRLRCSPDEIGSRWDIFPSVSPIHRGDDGLPFAMDDLTIPFPRWRNESVKAYGNAIVPQVIYEIFRAIEIVEGK